MDYLFIFGLKIANVGSKFRHILNNPLKIEKLVKSGHKEYDFEYWNKGEIAAFTETDKMKI